MLSDIEGKCICFCQTFSWRNVKTAFCKSIGRFWRNIFGFKRNYFLYLFRTFSEVYQPSGKLFQQGFQMCSLSVHKKFLRRSFSLGFFKASSNIDRQIFGQLWKFWSTGLLKLHSTCIDNCFEKRMENLNFFLFTRFWGKNSEAFFKIFSMDWSKLHSAYLQKKLRKNTFFWKSNVF